ncbi:O-antigen ligase family protein, partial [Acidimicrobiaceae bacterium]|nr:O-antigen ligase family protein [Acidimicrobiaceae bacterium]
VANFILILFQIQLPGTIDGWVSSNTDSINPFTSGRLGGFQGGGPNVIGIICAVFSLVCIYKVLSAESIFKSIISDKLNSFLLFVSLINLFFTFSRGSYIALFVGVVILILFSQKFSINHKVFFIAASVLFIVITIYVFPGIFLKESNRSFLNSLGAKNTKIFIGAGGGNYVKNVYKDYLVTLDDDVLFEEFNITYSAEEKENVLVPQNEDVSGPVEGFLKLEFDYMDNLLPRSIVSFYYSNNGSTWTQIGSNHTNGTVIDLIENDSFFEVGGWGDGQSPGDQYLSGYINSVKIQTNEYSREYLFSKEKRDVDYLLLTPLNKNEFEDYVEYQNNSIRLDRPRNYWVALPNEVNLSKKDFEVIIELNLNGVPKGHETLMSQSSILRLNDEFNDQSWKWSIINGRMYFFWIQEVISGYSNFVGGQSLRSGKLISNNGDFDSVISDFSLSQYDEITTSHNGFLTMSVEYGVFLILLIILLIIYFVLRNFNKSNELELAIFLMFLTQNLTNDLIYAPDVAIYFWLIPIYFSSKILRVNN